MSDSGVSGVRGVRRATIVVIIASLGVAAVLGIAALLSDEFGDLQSRILLTTMTIAAFGTTSLCHLAVVTRSVRAVGFAGIAASLGAAICALVLIWLDRPFGTDGEQALYKAVAVLAIAALSLAQANLLLLLAGRRHPVIRVSLAVTLVAVAVVAVMIALPVLTDGGIPGNNDDAYWRWLGVMGILDALGTIALPVLGLVLRAPAPDQPEPSSTVRLVLDLPAELAERLDARAAGGSREAAAIAALERELG
ncbi:hypothetical protein [Pseudonocardia sp. TRM90224]|uniref:hypothetical protein n=1 Tax=Pseudonocardia sp. TRM90224 TaxID=2812678 RepID=UPI001E3AD1A8|nr:hypothetical protein [Pseudonocardia sp. TRM90224]